MNIFKLSVFIWLMCVANACAQDSGFAVVELFTSEGCSSCPPADRIAADVHQKAQEAGQAVYVLGFHVDYWNGLGWPDPFSKPEYSARQRNYAAKLGDSGVYTPQVIVNGREGFGGYDKQRLEREIERSLAQPAADLLETELLPALGGGSVLRYRLNDFDGIDTLLIAIV